jgi:hypothetical protein
MRRPLLFVGEGFFRYSGSFAGGRLKGWRDLLASTVPFSTLVRCLAGAPIASFAGPARLFPPLFGVLIHRTPPSTTAALRPPERLRWPGGAPFSNE